MCTDYMKLKALDLDLESDTIHYQLHFKCLRIRFYVFLNLTL
jgi:hypothetical protein